MVLRPLEDIKLLIIHCADTPNGLDLYRIEDIDAWHKARGFMRSIDGMGLVGSPAFMHCGYHYVIHVDGTVHRGRGLTEIGAHASGWNQCSVGICLVGKDAFTNQQWSALKLLHQKLTRRLGSDIATIGHRETNEKKQCPGFNVQEWLRDGKAIAVCQLRQSKKRK